MSRRLAAEGLGEHSFGQHRAEGDEQFLDIGEFGAPGGPVGPVELIDEVFGNALEIRPRIFDLRGALFDSCHLRPLSELASNERTEFPPASVGLRAASCKPRRAPGTLTGGPTDLLRAPARRLHWRRTLALSRSSSMASTTPRQELACFY